MKISENTESKITHAPTIFEKKERYKDSQDPTFHFTD